MSSTAPSASLHFFHVSQNGEEGSGVPGPSLDGSGEPARQRRQHTKSRSGCVACMRRKVKCDEAKPTCGHCVKRGEKCVPRRPPPPAQGRTRSTSYNAIPPSLEPRLTNASPSEINMLHMELFHHFGTSTVETLIFSKDIWRDQVMPLSLQHDFLMQAILLISATHLSHLVPSKASYQHASALHFSATLRLFRHALAAPIPSSNADALMAACLLLFHHAWAHPCLLPDEPGAENRPLDLSLDPLFSLANGLREVFVSSGLLFNENLSTFTRKSIYRSRDSILRAVYTSPKSPAEIESFFERCFRMLSPAPENEFLMSTAVAETLSSTLQSQLPTDVVDAAADPSNIAPDTDLQGPPSDISFYIDYMEAVARLAPVFALFNQPSPSQPPAVSSSSSSSFSCSTNADTDSSFSTNTTTSYFPPLSDLARYFFSLPVRSSPRFITLLRCNDPRNLILLLYFYRAVRALLPTDKYWWTQRRAEYMGRAMELELEKCENKKTRDVLEEAKNLLETGCVRNGRTLAWQEEPLREEEVNDDTEAAGGTTVSSTECSRWKQLRRAYTQTREQRHQ